MQLDWFWYVFENGHTMTEVYRIEFTQTEQEIMEDDNKNIENNSSWSLYETLGLVSLIVVFGIFSVRGMKYLRDDYSPSYIK